MLLLLLFSIFIPVSSIVVLLLIMKRLKEEHEIAKNKENKYKELKSLVETLDTNTLQVDHVMELFGNNLNHVVDSKCLEYVKALQKLVISYGRDNANQFIRNGTVYEALSIHQNWVNYGPNSFKLADINSAFPSTNTITESSDPQYLITKYCSLEMEQLKNEFSHWSSASKYLGFACVALYFGYVLSSFTNTESYEKRFGTIQNLTNRGFGFEQRYFEYLFPFMKGWIKSFAFVMASTVGLQYLYRKIVKMNELWEKVQDFSVVVALMFAFISIFSCGFIAVLITVYCAEVNGIPWVLFQSNLHLATSSHLQIFHLSLVCIVCCGICGMCGMKKSNKACQDVVQ